MKACKVCGAPALEQVRGHLTENDKGYVAPRGVGPEANSNNPANATDTRVVCSNTKLAMRGPGGAPVVIEADAKAWNFSYNGEGFVFPLCDNQTGWNKAEFSDYTRFIWDRDHGA